MRKLSVVVPVYRDELIIEQTFETLKRTLDEHSLSFTYEIILVNDGSPDKSLDAIERLQQKYPDLAGVVNLVRNFGQVPAILAGFEVAAGDCIAAISSDLQDPPELIPQFFAEWEKGADAVIGTRETREDPLPVVITSRMFYWSMRKYALPGLPMTGFDFFLVDRRVGDRMLANQERNAFLQGMILQSSARVKEIPYHRRPRTVGTSGWTTFKRVKYFVDGFVGYSFMPIRLITVLGIAMFFFGIVMSAAIVFQTLFFGTRALGWSSIIISLLLLHGIEMLILGILGEYLWRALDQVRARPVYLIDWRKLPKQSHGVSGQA
jgi:glycosyltransferase involved in cell wall biosynthesis